MNFLFRRNFVLLSFGVGLGWMAWQSSAQNKPKSTPKPKPKSAMIAEIRDYKVWHEVTQKPVAMDSRVASMCATPNFSSRSTAPPIVMGTQGPHRKKYIRVYVNPLGEAQMTTQKQPRFAVGSVIVKEKLPLIESQSKSGKRQQKIGAKPELLTVMIKREKGYDAQNGDWEFLVSDGAGKQITQRGKIEACQNCHRPYEKTDYIVRSYLPPEVEKALQEADASLVTPQRKGR